MPADLAAEAARMTTAAALVAAVTAPLVVGGWVLARLLGRPICPRWRQPSSAWTGLDIVFLFGLHLMLPPTWAVALGAIGAVGRNPGEMALAVAGLLAYLFAVPTLFAVAVLIRLTRPVPLTLPDPGRTAADVALAAAVWVPLTAATLAVHFAALTALQVTGVEAAEHPLTRVPIETADQMLLFAVVACLLTPLAEEFLFRGLLVGWAAERNYRPWLVVAGAGLLSLGGLPNLGSLGLAACVAVGLLATQAGRRLWPRFPDRTAAAVWASAGLFAAAHSAVWPSPVPLFALGLGLGYLAARTRGIAASTVAHGLFNAVSFAYLLRGG